jgi:hypothetical protein
LWGSADDDQFTLEAAGVLSGHTGKAIAEVLESLTPSRESQHSLSLAAFRQADYVGIRVRASARGPRPDARLESADG